MLVDYGNWVRSIMGKPKIGSAAAQLVGVQIMRQGSGIDFFLIVSPDIA